MEERIGKAFAGTEPLTVTGKHLHPGEAAPDFCLDYLDLVDSGLLDFILRAVTNSRTLSNTGMARVGASSRSLILEQAVTVLMT